VTDRNACVFFDDARGRNSALCDLRASFEVRTGALTTLERISLTLRLSVVGAFVPGTIRGVVAERHPFPVNQTPAVDPSQQVLLVNGRCPLPLDVMEELGPGQAAVEASSGDLICARLTWHEIERLLTGEDPTRERIVVEDRVLIDRPWDLIQHRDRALSIDLSLLSTMPRRDMADYPWLSGEHPLSVHPSARVSAGVSFDLEHGPIVVDEHAALRCGSVIIGPAYIGRGSTVTEQATIRGNTAIGPVCKVGGEISGTVFQGYSNKAHEGYVGDSWIGEWVNLGAGTTTSNLLNTYGLITAAAEPGAPRERTGLTFLGAMIGDHSKTAIHTRLMGGSVLATGTMWACSRALREPTHRFAWVTDDGERRYRLGRFVDAMEAMMARRSVQPTAEYRSRLEALHAESER
jgi:UDP-N-acetylglucosamine diphosphorylase/glucosamine-1-phosphate N-acetyltransferase